MKAIEITDTKKITIIEKDKPVISDPFDVIVKVAAVSICGTDIHTFTNTHPFVKPPVVVGHECSGVVAEIGTGVTGVKPGDRVAIDPVLGCGTCRPCKTGRANACANVSCRGVHVEGAMQEFFKVRERDVYKLPDSLKDLVLGASVEPFAIGAQAVWRGNVSAGQVMVIFGAGPIGLTTMFMAMNRGARCIMIDMKEDRLANAVKLGAIGGVLATAEDLKEQVLALSEEGGPDVTCDAVGNPAIVDLCVDLVAPTGTVILLGMDGQQNSVTELSIFRKELTIVGSRMNSAMFPTVLELIAKNVLPLDAILTHRFTVDEASEAFTMAIEQPEGFTKAVITF
ncbi:MAG: threonine dehydrogenase-like Zn-dependent dehydrogenase [Desulforhopalus sp.]|jgi:threonine dehydrogenase-like Zn-dependent dehydrogenase